MILYSVEGLHYDQLFFFLLILFDDRFDRSKVLHITQVNMVDERTLTRQERASELQGLGVPVLRLLLLIIGGKLGILLHLKDKSNLSGVAEVRNSHVRQFEDE